MFSIKYPHHYMYYFLEFDRGTEPLKERQNSKTSSIMRKFKVYQEMYRSNLYKKHFGLESLVTLIVTINKERMESMRKIAEELGIGNYLVFAYVEEYGKPLVPPKPAPELMTRDWIRANGQPFSLLTGK